MSNQADEVKEHEERANQEQEAKDKSKLDDAADGSKSPCQAQEETLQKNCVDETSSQDVLTKDAASSNETKDRLQGSPSHESNPEELSSSGESGKADLMKAIQEMEESQDAETGRGNKEQELGGMNKEQETTSCGQGSTEVDRSSFLCFRNNYFEVIEELRMARVLESENEEKIRNLMTEKHELERKQEEAADKYSVAVDNQSKKEEQIRKQYEDRLRLFEEEKAKQELLNECREKEMKTLKDEMRSLHLSKYSLEKQVKDQERRIQLRDSGRESFEVQISELERRYKELSSESDQLSELKERVEANVSEASRLHRKLIYANHHQKCLLDSYKRELQSNKQEVVTLKATVARQNDSLAAAKQEKLHELEELQRQLRTKAELAKQTEDQLSKTRIENKDLLASLNSAHGVINKHVESINRHTETEALAHLELDELRTEHEKLKEMHRIEIEGREELGKINERIKNELLQEKEGLTQRMETLQQEHSNLAQAHNALEEQNSSWSAQNAERATQIDNLQQEIRSLQSSLQEAKSDLVSKAEDLASLKESYNKELMSMKDELSQAKKESTDLRNDLEDSKNTIKKNEALTSELRRKLEETENEIKEQSMVMKEQLAEAKKESTELQAALEAAKASGRNDSDTIAQLRRKLEKLQNHVTVDVGIQTNLKDFQIPVEGSSGPPQCQELQPYKSGEDDPSPSETVDIKLTDNADMLQEDSCNMGTSNSWPAAGTESNFVHGETNGNRIGQKEAVRVLEPPRSTVDTGEKLGINDDIDSEPRRYDMNDPEPDRNNNIIPQRDQYVRSTDNESRQRKGVLKGACSTPAEKPQTDGQRQENEILKGKSCDPLMEKEVEVSSKIKQDGSLLVNNNKKSSEGGKRSPEIPFMPGMKPTKKVRFNLESDKSQAPTPSSSTLSQNADQTVPPVDTEMVVQSAHPEELQGLFSDEEDDLSMERGVSSQISRIQNLLKSNRLRTNRKRKFPVL